MTKKDTLPYSTILVFDVAERDITSIALILNNDIQISKEAVRAQDLPKLIDALLKKNKLLPSNIDALAIIKRGGSMTAIRIGTTVVNTLGWINKLPIIELEASNIDMATKKIRRGDVDKVVKTSLPLM